MKHFLLGFFCLVTSSLEAWPRLYVQWTENGKLQSHWENIHLTRTVLEGAFLRSLSEGTGYEDLQLEHPGSRIDIYLVLLEMEEPVYIDFLSCQFGRCRVAIEKDWIGWGNFSKFPCVAHLISLIASQN